jgi:hypothetical protein
MIKNDKPTEIIDFNSQIIRLTENDKVIIETNNYLFIETCLRHVRKNKWLKKCPSIKKPCYRSTIEKFLDTTSHD